jgi:hypothetical protein
MFGGELNSMLQFETQDPFLQIISQAHGGGYLALLNATTFKEAALVAFQNRVAQMIHKYLVTPSGASLPGRLLQSENRLPIKRLPVVGYDRRLSYVDWSQFRHPILLSARCGAARPCANCQHCSCHGRERGSPAYFGRYGSCKT